FTGRRIQCQHAIGKKVCAFSGTAINEFTCSGSGCREYPTAFLINRQSTPGIGGAVDHILLPLPCIISVLTWERNRVEYPLELSGQCIICPYVARRTGVAFRLTAGYDEVMLVYNTLCCDLNVDPFRRDRKVRSYIDEASPILTEGLYPFSCLRVNRRDTVPNGVEYSLVGTVFIFPVNKTTRAATDYFSIVILRRSK